MRQVDPATGAMLVTSFTYDNAGRVTMEDGPLPGIADAKFYRYDVHGRRTWEIDATGAGNVRTARRHSYSDSDDKPTMTEEGTVSGPDATSLNVLRRTEFAYDSRRNPSREAAVTGTTTQLWCSARSTSPTGWCARRDG